MQAEAPSETTREAVVSAKGYFTYKRIQLAVDTTSPCSFVLCALMIVCKALTTSSLIFFFELGPPGL